ncbi:MAG: rhomboid family intramembrane serine protease [Anaerolineae bacterium]|nr:rhomboid family intramembrane serine protease [Anaerolineae bacterium]MDW8098137.1 rhomboid family intramembrane serine protease [Anaerolineae bacterium]
MNDPLSAGEQTETLAAHPERAMVAIPLSQPLWSWVILSANVAICLAMMAVTTARGGGLLAGSLGISTPVLIIFGAKVNQLIADGEFWRLLTANFLHVSLMHLLFNTYALWQLGPEVERLYGRARFLTIYLLTAVYGATASYAWGGELSAGASGAIFGLVGTLVAYFLRYRELFGRRGRAYLSSMVMIVVINLLIGISTPGIDNWGHIGGLISGFLLGYGLAPAYMMPHDYLDGPVRLIDASSPTRRAVILAIALALLIAAVSAITAARS